MTPTSTPTVSETADGINLTTDAGRITLTPQQALDSSRLLVAAAQTALSRPYNPDEERTYKVDHRAPHGEMSVETEQITEIVQKLLALLAGRAEDEVNR